MGRTQRGRRRSADTARWTRVSLGLLAAGGAWAAACGDDDVAVRVDAGGDAAVGTPDASTLDARTDEGDAGRIDAAVGMDASVPDGGDADGGVTGDGGAGDGGIALGCPPSLLVTSTDFSTTSIAHVNAMTGEVREGTAIAEGDVVPAYVGCRPFLLARASGRILVQSEGDPLITLATLETHPAGGPPFYASNPQTLAPAGDRRAYAVFGSLNELGVVEYATPASGPLAAGIDLSAFVSDEDSDGIVDAVDAIALGTRVYAGLARFSLSKGISFDADSLLVAVDATTDTVVDASPLDDATDAITLMGKNPWRGLEVDAPHGVLYVAAAGAFDALDGGIEAIDVGRGESNGFVLTEEALGAELEGIVLATSTQMFVLAGGSVRIFDPSSGAISRGAIATSVTAMERFRSGVVLASGNTVRWIDPLTSSDVTPGDEPVVVSTNAISGVAGTP